ncbi:MAG: hypothetical protein H6728_13430 [Myxococcales bacterium]|nr:hypothetical protein [Myxococcales bacterium]MCB9644071.1 hypothetical protein [Myxococcales bacterium]
MKTWLPKILILSGVLALVLVGRACMVGYFPGQEATNTQNTNTQTGKVAEEVPGTLPRPLFHLAQVSIAEVEILINADPEYRKKLKEELTTFFGQVGVMELKTTEEKMKDQEVEVLLRVEIQQEGKILKLPQIEKNTDGALEAAIRLRDTMMKFRASTVPKTYVEARITYRAKIVPPTVKTPVKTGGYQVAPTTK